MINSGYLPGSTFLHSCDPRLKLGLLIFLAVSFFFPVPIFIYGAYLGFLVLITLFTLGPRELWIPVRTILPLLILVALLTPPFHRSGETLLVLWGPVLISTGGLAETLRLLLRFTGITVSFFLFFRSTDIETLILTLRWYRLPFSLALVLTIAFRYIPYIASLYKAVSDAHSLRRPMLGTPREKGDKGGSRDGFTGKAAPGRSRKKGLRDRLRRIFPTLVSVMIHSVKTIPGLSMTLETRGFGRPERRTSLYSLPPLKEKSGELITALLLLVLVLLPLFLL